MLLQPPCVYWRGIWYYRVPVGVQSIGFNLTASLLLVPLKHKQNNPNCNVKIRIHCTPGDNLLILCCVAAGCAVQVACGSHLKVPLPCKQTASVLWDFPTYCTWERQGLPTTVEQGFLFPEWVTVRFRSRQIRGVDWTGYICTGFHPSRSARGEIGCCSVEMWIKPAFTYKKIINLHKMGGKILHHYVTPQNSQSLIILNKVNTYYSTA